MEGTHKILIVDSDPHICEIVQAYCEREGFISFSCHSGIETVKLIKSFELDLMVLDVRQAKNNGLDCCMNARGYANVPIVFLSNDEEDMEKISALFCGGVDYVTKPFSPGVLMAKIKAYFRSVSTVRREQLLELPGLTLDFHAQSVLIREETLSLSKIEFNLLSFMAQNVNRVIRVEELHQLICGIESLVDTRPIAVHMSNLRRKIETDPDNPKKIVTIWGTGYKMVASGASQTRAEFEESEL